MESDIMKSIENNSVIVQPPIIVENLNLLTSPTEIKIPNINGDHTEEFNRNNINDDVNEDSSCSSETGGLIIDSKEDNTLENDSNSIHQNVLNPFSLKRKCEFEDDLNISKNEINYKKMYSSYTDPQQDMTLPQDLFNDNNENLPTTPLNISNQPNWNFLNTQNLGYSNDIKHLLKEQFKYRKGCRGKLNQFESNTSEYAQYLGLQPAVKFKCFKCAESKFPSLLELKEHQTVCLKTKLSKTNFTKSDTSIKSLSTNTSFSSSSSSNCSVVDSSLTTSYPASHLNYTSTKPNSNTVQNGEVNNKSRVCNANNDPSTKIRITRKVFLCSACGTYYENWNLFLHMREVHKRHICLYCLGLFPTSERLVNHLENKHSIVEKKYENRESLLKSYNTPCYLMCSNCEHVFNELDNFHNHLCENYFEPCSSCGMKGTHISSCKSAFKNSTKTHKENRKRKNLKQNQQKNVNQPQQKSPETPLTQLNIYMTNGYSNHNSSGQQNASNTNVAYNGENLIENNSHLQGVNNSDYVNLTYNAAAHNENLKTSLEGVLKEPVPPDEINHGSLNEAPEENLNESFASTETNDDQQLSDIENHNQSTSSISASSPSSDDEDDEQRNMFPKSSTPSFATIISKPTTEDEVSGGPLLVPKLKIKLSAAAFHKSIEPDGSSESENENNLSASKSIDEDVTDNLSVSKSESELDVSMKSVNIKSDTIDEEEKEKVIEVDGEEGDQTSKEPVDNESELKIKIDELKCEVNTEIDKNVTEETALETIDSKDENIKSDKIENDSQQANSETIESKEEKIESIDNKYINEDDIKSETKEDSVENIPSDGIIVASEDALTLELTLELPLDKLPIRDFLKKCIKASFPYCLYCNHARMIAVNGKALALHLIEQHRYSATVDSITAEELLPNTIVAKIKSHLSELDTMYFNLDTYDSEDKEILPSTERSFECFQCRFITKIHKELYLHNRKLHLKSILLCIMCKLNFYSYSELVCHMCPGIYNKIMILDLTFRCCLCNLENIPSAFRLMVHLRKKHNACDVCLEECYDQSRLSNHVWKHKLHHLCYRCGIAYRNKPDITKHLFWKHGTESVLCKTCLQKKWPHVYHFCIPPSIFVCEVCNLVFNRAVSLKVHKRLHTGDAKYPCNEDDCEKKFISRKLLLKHVERHSMIIEEVSMNEDINIKEEKTEESITEPEKENIEPVEQPNLEENVSNATTQVKEEKEKKKKKKSEKGEKKVENSKNLIDLIDLPALNLSESDSSEDESNQNSTKFEIKPDTERNADELHDIENLDENPAPLNDIWDNFRSFQESQKQHTKPVEDPEIETYPTPPILHVVQSDHDYAMMYVSMKVLNKKDDTIVLDELNEGNPELLLLTKESSKKSENKKKNSDSSSSDSSSGSDSCSCGTDCSCSSSDSGSSSSSSSSSDDEDSSSSETRRKKALKKERRLENERNKSDSKSQSENIDVVAPDPPKITNVDPDSIILESDLETDESETDEDFYDQHPQKLASQMLAEKRRLLMLQTCTNPMNNAIVENSRPSTPSLPEEVAKEKRVKIKKKKKKKNSACLVAPLKLNIPLQNRETVDIVVNDVQTSMVDSLSKIMTPPLQLINPPQAISSANSTPVTTPSLISGNPRLSTGSGSETDGTLKRSKRRRIPNRFYGYSSDEEASPSPSINLLKPQPPPNLTWRKEDLPSPTPVRTPPVSLKTKIKSPNVVGKTPSGIQKQKSGGKTSSSSNAYPPIPSVIIKTPQHIQPPRVEPLRVPSVPVHHIAPVVINSESNQTSDSSDSDSSNEGSLQIFQTPVQPLKTKIVLNRSKNKSPRIKNSSVNNMAAMQNIGNQSMLQHQAALQQQQMLQHQQMLQQQHILQQQQQSILQQQHHHTMLQQQAFLQHHQNMINQQPLLQSIQQTASPQQQNLLQQHASYMMKEQQRQAQFYPKSNIYPGYNQVGQPNSQGRVVKEGESVYCYCQCPYDEVSEMIACDGDNCQIEWFHFECVGIMVPPKGKWYCPDCKPKYLSGNNEYLEEDNT